MRGLLLAAVQAAYRASLGSAWARFARALARPQDAQRERLRAALAEARGTAFGRAHGLDGVRTLDDFRRAAPIRDYAGHAPWIERAWQGEPAVLTRAPVVAFERTSGSTERAKHIPYTRPLLADFAAATGPWLRDLLTRAPALRRGSAYWSISPLVRGGERERSPGGAPVGLESDADYLPAFVRALRRVVLPVPDAVARLADLDACRYATLRYLLADPRLAFVSVWSPSFFTLLIGAAAAHADRLARDLERGTLDPPGGPLPRLLPPWSGPDRARAAAVRAAFADPARPRLERIWPRLALVSAWADAEAARALPALAALLPRGVHFQPKGLIATEGVVSIPLLGVPGGAALAVASHLIELAPVAGARAGASGGASGAGPAGEASAASDPAPDAATLLPHEAELGGRYVPVITTRGGLYRYALGDEVEVTGFARATPLVRFLGKRDGTADLAGEKLSPALARAAIAGALAAVGLAARFALLAPDAGGDERSGSGGARTTAAPRAAVPPPRYALFVEPAAAGALAAPEARAALAAALERELGAAHHYGYARRLGQLGPAEVAVIEDGARRYEAALVARGARAGDVKPVSLHRGRFWREALGAREPG